MAVRDDCATGTWHGREPGQQAGLPEPDHVGEAGEQVGETGEDEGVQRCHRPGLGGAQVGLGLDAGGEAGDLVGQG